MTKKQRISIFPNPVSWLDRRAIKANLVSLNSKHPINHL